MLTPSPLSTLFCGWMIIVEPEADFVVDSRQHVMGWDEPEDKALGPYESPTPMPILSDIPGPLFNTPDGKSALPYHHEQMAWAGFSLGLQSIAKLIGGTPRAHQHNTYDSDGKLERPTYSFRFEQGADGWQCAEGARL